MTEVATENLGSDNKKKTLSINVNLTFIVTGGI